MTMVQLAVGTIEKKTCAVFFGENDNDQEKLASIDAGKIKFATTWKTHFGWEICSEIREDRRSNGCVLSADFKKVR